MFGSEGLIVTGGIQLCLLRPDGPRLEPVVLRVNDEKNPTFSVEISPDGRWLAASLEDEQIHYWPLRLDELTDRAKRIAGAISRSRSGGCTSATDPINRRFMSHRVRNPTIGSPQPLPVPLQPRQENRPDRSTLSHSAKCLVRVGIRTPTQPCRR